MANCYYVDMIVKGRKESLDELQKLLQQELDEGQSSDHFYNMTTTIKRMGFDPKEMDVRAYTESVERKDDNSLAVIYVGAWDGKPDVRTAIRKHWLDVSIDWYGVDEFGQYPETNIDTLVGTYKIEDEDEGASAFDQLPEWVTEEDALPVINEYYHTNYTSIHEAAKKIKKLCVSDMMEPCENDDSDKSVFALAVDYLRDELDDDERAVIDAQGTAAWKRRMPIHTDYDDKIVTLLNEFGESYDLTADWWEKEYEIEDFIKEL